MNDADIDETVILRRILKKYAERLLAGFILLVIRKTAKSLWVPHMAGKC